jgi:hypothetical protein
MLIFLELFFEIPIYKEIIILDVKNLGTKSNFYGALILYYNIFIFSFIVIRVWGLKMWCFSWDKCDQSWEQSLYKGVIEKGYRYKTWEKSFRYQRGKKRRVENVGFLGGDN